MSLYSGSKGFAFDAFVAKGDAAYFGIVTFYSLSDVNKRLKRRGIPSWEDYTLSGVESIQVQAQQGNNQEQQEPTNPEKDKTPKKDALMMVVVPGKNAKQAYRLLRTMGRLEYVPDLRKRAPMRVVYTIMAVMAFCVISGFAIWSVFLIGGQL